MNNADNKRHGVSNLASGISGEGHSNVVEYSSRGQASASRIHINVAKKSAAVDLRAVLRSAFNLHFEKSADCRLRLAIEKIEELPVLNLDPRLLTEFCLSLFSLIEKQQNSDDQCEITALLSRTATSTVISFQMPSFVEQSVDHSELPDAVVSTSTWPELGVLEWHANQLGRMRIDNTRSAHACLVLEIRRRTGVVASLPCEFEKRFSLKPEEPAEKSVGNPLPRVLV